MPLTQANIRFASTLALVATVLLVAGCVMPTAPNYEARFGENARILRAHQIIDADAPRRNNSMMPVDGKAAAGAQKNYAESHGYTVKESAPAPVQLPTSGSK